jgi:hypothetical protein
MSHLFPACPSASAEAPLALLAAFLERRCAVASAQAPDAAAALQEIFRVGDFLFGGTFEGAISILDDSTSLITRVVSAPSQRTAYLVTSSGKQSSRYLCLLPKGPSCQEGAHYCSCRSFLEKNARAQDLHPCKHLLALRLLPYVGVQCTTIETLSDEEFGRLLVGRGSPV